MTHTPESQRNREEHPTDAPTKQGDVRLARNQLHESIEGLVFDAKKGDLTLSPDNDPLPPPQKIGTPTYMTKETPLTALQIQTWEQVKEKYAELLRLEKESAEDVFGKKLKDAFFDPKKLEAGEITMCVGCMDERVPGPKIGVAGAGVLMTEIPTKEWLAGKNEKEIYEYLADPKSGDDHFRIFTKNLKDRMAEGWKLDTSEHQGCGAVGIFCNNFFAATNIRLDKNNVAKAAAARLHKELGLPDTHKKAGYEKADIAMDGHLDIHDGYCIIIDGTGRFDPSKLGIRGLLISARYSPSDGYMQAEVNAGKGILGGSHGVGIQNMQKVPVLLVGDPENAEFSVQKLRTKLGNSIDDANVLTMTA